MDGYAKLATMMGAYPEVAILRRFAALNMQNVLYLQAELVNLESRLRRCEKEDRESGDQTRVDFAVDWFKLSNSKEIVTPLAESASSRTSFDGGVTGSLREETTEMGESRRCRVIMSIREKLKEYNDAVIQQATLAQLSKPNPRDLKFLKDWMIRPDMGNVILEGQDSDVWENPDRLDLVVLKPRQNESLLSAWLSDRFIHWYHQTVGFRLKSLFTSNPELTTKTTQESASPIPSTEDPETVRLDSIAQLSSMTYHSQTTLLRVARVSAMMLASLLPIAAIVILYTVQSMPKRLGTIGGFTAAFSLVLGLVTHGELIDVFAASAAFAAVQVVFVGSSNVGNGTCRAL